MKPSTIRGLVIAALSVAADALADGRAERELGDFAPNLPPATARTAPKFVNWKCGLSELLGSARYDGDKS